MLSFLNLDKRSFILIAVLLLGAIGTGWVVYELKQGGDDTQAVVDNNPDGFMRVATITQLTEQGTPKIELISPKLVHYPDNSTDMTTPHFIIYSEDGKGEPWHIYAKYGRAINGMEALHLWDDVRIIRAESEGDAKTTILTSALSVYPDKKYLETDKEVTFIQPGTQMKSLGVRAYEDGRIELLSNVRGKHVPTEDSDTNNLQFLPSQ